MTSVQASPGSRTGRRVEIRDERPDPGAGTAARRRWWVLFGASAGALLAWSFAFPILAGPDEGPHAARAASVARGQLTGPVVAGVTDLMHVRVPEAYRHFDRGACFQPSPFNPRPADRTPRCVPPFRGGWRLVEVGTYEFRGFPLAYGLIGLPTLAAPDRVGMYAMRALGALVGAGLVAGALASTWRHGQALAPAALGILVALTPQVWHLGGLINPNGLEILAAVGLWSALCGLCRAAVDDPEVPRLLGRGGFALVVLVGVRPLGPLAALVALAAFAALSGRARLGPLLRHRRARAWLAASAVVIAVHGWWLLAFGLHHPTDRPGLGLLGSLRRWPGLGREAVGLFGSNTIPAPRPVLWVWATVAAGLVLLGWWAADRRDRFVLGAVAVVGFGLTTGADGLNLPPIGFDWQGRYGLPFYVGVPILAGRLAAGAAQRSTPARLLLTDRLARLGVAALSAVHVVAFVAVGRRLGMGSPAGANPFDYLLRPEWTPPLPPLLLLVVFTAAVAVIAGVVTVRRVR